MKPITEELRQSLIEYGKLFNSGGTKGKTGLLIEIALASLTANEVGYVAAGETSIPSVEYCAPVVAGDCLYTDPPVPVIKLPDEILPMGQDSEYDSGHEEGWSDCLAEIKRLNGLS